MIMTNEKLNTCSKQHKCIREEQILVEVYTLIYRLMESTAPPICFSVSVSISTASSHEEQTAIDISRNRTKADKIFDLLVRNSVTPCTLTEILSEIL
jgi:hypothetical protein